MTKIVIYYPYLLLIRPVMFVAVRFGQSEFYTREEGIPGPESAMKKHLLILLMLASVLIVSLQAQEGLTFSAAPLVSLPLGSSADLYSIGMGAGLETRFPLSGRPIYGFGQFTYQNLLLEAGAGDLQLLSLGGGLTYLPLRASFLSGGISAGAGGYLGMYSDSSPLGNPYLSAGLSFEFDFGKGFRISLAPEYRNYLATRDSRVSAFYSGMDVSLRLAFEPSAMGGGTRRPQLQIMQPEFRQVFPVIYKYYDENSIGTVVIKNGESRPARNVKIDFFVPQYMDGPQTIAEIEELGVREERTIPITALFQNSVLEITEKDTVQGQLLVNYNVGETNLSARRNESLRIYDRNAISWDDDRKAAAFVSAKDPTILKFSRNVTSETASLDSMVLNKNLADGIALFEALKAYGLEYKIDPDSSYEVLSQNESLTDYLQFPVQTLDYRTGDCDDLSILYCSMLEAVSVKTAFITTPGHIFTAFSLGIPPSEAEKVFSTMEQLVIIDDEVWVPVEITLLNEGFLKAWEAGARQWREASRDGRAGFIPIRSSWSVYEPSWFGSGENENVIDRIPSVNAIASAYKQSMDQLIEIQITPLVETMEKRIARMSSSRLLNQFGTLYARYGLLDKAEVQFEKAAAQNYVPAIVNLGNIHYLNERYPEAQDYYQRAYSLRPENTDVLLALARTGFAMEDYRQARKYYEIAELLDPQQASKFAYISGGSSETGRASDIRERTAILWSEE